MPLLLPSLANGLDNLWPCYHCCSNFWIPQLAAFGDQCLGIVGWIPTWISLVIVLFRYGLGPLWRRRPLWLRNFAAEDDTAVDEMDSSKQKSWGASAIALFIISLLGMAVGVIAVVFDLGPMFLIPLLPCAISCMIVAGERPRSLAGAIFGIHAALFLTQLLLLTTLPQQMTWQTGLVWGLETAVSFASLLILLNMPMRDPCLDNSEISPAYDQPTKELRSPEDDLSLWRWMSVSWMKPLISMGCERRLDDEDVWLLPYSFQHDRLHNLFREVRGSVTRRLVKANGPDLIITVSLGVLESLASLSQIVLLKQLLAALQSEQPSRRVAVVYAAFILFARLVGAQSGIFSLWFCRRAYERSRGEMITMVYEKTLRRKAFTFPSDHKDEKGHISGHNGPASTGKILNLMRNDVYEIAQRFWEFPNLVTKPLNFILSLVLIWRIIGPASLLGIILIISVQLINSWIIRLLVNWERARRAITDLKLQITSQFVEAIRHLRWYDWQDRWLNQILEVRQKELFYRVISNLLSKIISAMNHLAAYMFPVVAFYAYTVIGKKPLTVDIAFPALNLFTMLNSNLRELPDLITVLLNAAVAMGRIESFMAEPNKDDEPGSLESRDEPHGPLELEIINASFCWPGSQKTVLDHVSVSCSTGLTAVCGSVGVGKTALLQAILGEMDQNSGKRIVPNEMIGYCAQSPWLQSMSIKDNILFSRECDQSRYEEVLDTCCLNPDISNFKGGDEYLVGENGVGLSGGQKARVALARAIYSKARILLLDDPIAALDHQTAETILKKLFTRSSLAQGRMIIFVTHRMDLLTRYADQVFEVSPLGHVQVITRDEINMHDELLHFTATEDPPETADEEQTTLGSNGTAVKVIEEEYRATGGVMASVYWKYVKAGKLRFWVILMLVFGIFRVSRMAHFYYLKIWGEAYNHDSDIIMTSNAPEYHISTIASREWLDIDLGLPPPDENVRPWLFWFFIIAVCQFVSFFVSDLFIILLIYTAGKRLFEDVMRKVTNATFRFYDVTPIGRLMNRLTSDIGTVDGQVVNQIQNVAWYFIAWVSSLVVIGSATPVFLAIAILMTIMFIYIFLRFLPASQSLRRLEMVSLSPLMSNFGTLLEGLTTVRAFRAQPHFQDRIIVTTDAFQKMDHFYWSLQAWLQYRFDTLSALSTFMLTMTALFTGLSAGTVGFVLTAAANFVQFTHQLCRRYGELQMQFVSVERVIELMDLEEEPEGNVSPPAAWPSYADDVIFENVTVRYAPHLDPSLQDLSFRIPAGSTVAVTGRTGSGKSTLALTLLGTIPPERDATAYGTIRIGAIDITNVNKHMLRRRISFVAQDPVLFPGTLRDNLDPIGEHTDEECALVLRRVFDGAGHFTLESRVDGGGKNLSQGQRQLVGLGRAVLRRSPVVILDEATASIDKKTAFYIQQVLREELKESTVITIAHRVEAVKDADYEIVLEKGKLLKCGPTKSIAL